MDGQVREKLLNNADTMNNMDNQLIDIERMGHETAGIMRSNNEELRN